MARQQRAIWQAVRAPVLWAVVGGALVCSKAWWIPNLFITANYFVKSGHQVYSISGMRPDYWLYLPNLVIWLAYLPVAMAIIELKARWHPRNRTAREDAWTVALTLGFAASSQLFMRNIKPGLLQIALSAMQVGLVWLFLLGNIGLRTVDRFLSGARAVRWLERTFPVSDFIWYRPHRLRASGAGWARWLPTVCLAALTLALFAQQARILRQAIPAERIAAPLQDINSALPADEGVWFANSDMWDPMVGIWYYDARTRQSSPVLPAFDARRFLVEDGSMYYHDRYDHMVHKVDMKSWRSVWRVPAALSGTFELIANGDRIFAVGEGGYILALDRNGRRLAERDFPVLTFEAQPIAGGGLAFVSGDQRIRLIKADLSDDETVELPLKDTVQFPYNPNNHAGLQIVTNMTAYAPEAGIFYSGTFWGEIFRYDVRNRRWLPSLKTHMGLRSITPDERNGLLFTANYFQGMLHVMQLDTGRTVGYLLANGRSRYIELDPVRMQGVFSTHGYGLYRFDYAQLARRMRLARR